MGATKERDYMFDIFRGLLMLSIPVSHFTKMTGNLYSSLYMGGGFPQATFFGFVYITINVFVMQAFMFLSGYFSKRPERARETAFQTFMWPYLVFTFIYFLIRIFFFGNAHLTFLSPPFALWFLFALFFYRFFLVDMVKFRWLLPLSIVLGLLAGQVEEWGDFMALGRTMSYFSFFIIGYYCSPERLAWLRKLKDHKLALWALGAVLVAISILLCFKGPNVGWLLLRESYHSFPRMTWWGDILLRAAIMVIASAWIVFMINVLPSKPCFLSYVGANTMPVYMFHLALRYVIQFYGLYMGLIGSLVVAWFGILGLTYKKWQNKAAYAALIVVSLAGAVALFSSGVLEPLYGKCPSNIYLAYVVCYAGAIITGCSLTSPFWISLYDFLTGGTKKLPNITRWLKGPGYEAED